MGTERGREQRAVEAKRPTGFDTPARARPSGPGAGLLALQAAAGNRAVTAALALQRKLSVGAADDPLEMEADRVARAVSDALGAGPVAAAGPEAAAGPVGTAGAGAVEAGSPRPDDETVVARSVRPVVRRHATIGLAGGELDDQTASALAGEIGRGPGLEPTTRRAMESAFGADFSGVRVHTGERSAALSEGMQASAFTLGSDIFFRGAPPDVTSRSGQELLAHELTHVVQQGGARSRRPDDGEA